MKNLAAGAAALALTAGMASAATITVFAASGDGSPQALGPNQADVFAADFGTFTGGGTWTTGVTTVTPPPMDEDQVYRSPWSGTGLENPFYAVGDVIDTQPNPATLDFGIAQSSLKLLWGSVDTYNTLTFGGISGGGADIVVTGTMVRDAINLAFPNTCLSMDVFGNFACTALVSISFGEGVTFTTATFYSDTQQAFEFAFIPLPAPALLLLTGMGALGGVAAIRRRRQKAA